MTTCFRGLRALLSMVKCVAGTELQRIAVLTIIRASLELEARLPFTPAVNRSMTSPSAHSSSETAAGEHDSRRLTLFAFFWATQTILELGKWGEMLANPLQFLLFSAACLVCVRPDAPLRLVGLAAAQAAVTLLKLPFLTNHTLVNTLGNLTLLASLIPVALERLHGPKTSRSGALQGTTWPEDWLARFAPLLRCELLLVYTFATFHKLNSDWFHPEQSCAVIFWERMIQLTPWPAVLRPLGTAMPFAALGCEIVIPILLAMPRWRLAGIGFGLCFHLLLGLIGFYGFSSIVMALYCLFLPDWVLTAGVDTFSAWRQQHSSWSHALDTLWAPQVRQILSGLIVLVALLALLRLRVTAPHAPLLLVREQMQESRRGSSLLFLGIWLLVTIGSGAVLCLLSSRSRPCPDRPGAARRLGWLWIFPFVTLLNGAAPYLGLKTQSSFAMFSNLRTSGRPSNHLLIHSPAAWLREGSDLVRIVDSSDPELLRVRDHDYLLPWMELCSYVDARLAKDGDFSVTLERGGEIREFASVEAMQDEFAHPSWLLRKLTWFRPVNMEPVCPCTH
ncbi:MAG: hypothetical protein ACK6D3_14920 [Planctomycetaceae bacterium]|jgi:hypothetical protein